MTMTTASADLEEVIAGTEERYVAEESPANVVLLTNDDNSAASMVDAPALSVLAVAAESDDDDDSIPMAVTEFMPSANQSIERRPTIISVTALKRTPKEDVGISIELVEDCLRIRGIEHGSIFAGTPIGEGDRILSVNNSTCVHQSLEHASRLITRSQQYVTVVVHRSDGDPFLLSTTVTKPESTSSVGIGIQNHDGSLCISTIDPSGLFAGSILSVGDKLVSVGGVSCACIDAASAADLIRNEKSTLTIVTWTKEEAGVVVAAVKPGPLYKRYTSFLPCLFSILLLAIIAMIVALTSRDKEPVQSSTRTGEPCKNLYGQPIPYTHC